MENTCLIVAELMNVLHPKTAKRRGVAMLVVMVRPDSAIGLLVHNRQFLPFPMSVLHLMIVETPVDVPVPVDRESVSVPVPPRLRVEHVRMNRNVVVSVVFGVELAARVAGLVQARQAHQIRGRSAVRLIPIVSELGVSGVETVVLVKTLIAIIILAHRRRLMGDSRLLAMEEREVFAGMGIATMMVW